MTAAAARADRWWRDLPTGALLAAQESVAWDRADLAADPSGWGFPEGSAAYLAAVAAEIAAEVARRERLRAHPLAPAPVDRRGELDAIKQRIDLPALVERYAPVRLRRCGRQLRGRCPFHHSRSDTSFVVDPERRLYFCHGCLKGGDPFDFVLELFALRTFGDAVDLLRLEAGLPPASRGSVVAAAVGRGRKGSVRVR